jgi:hypothetical protein
MGYLRNKMTGGVTAWMDSQTELYQALAAQRSTGPFTQALPVDMVMREEAGAIIGAGAPVPIWEDWPVERVAAQTDLQVLVGILNPDSVLTDDDVISLSTGEAGDVTFSGATYTPNEAITGTNTNYRTVEIVAEPEDAAAVVLASLAFTAGVNAEAGVPVTLTLGGSLNVAAGVPIVAKSVHTGTGAVEPGGLIVVDPFNRG